MVKDSTDLETFLADDYRVWYLTHSSQFINKLCNVMILLAFSDNENNISSIIMLGEVHTGLNRKLGMKKDKIRYLNGCFHIFGPGNFQISKEF